MKFRVGDKVYFSSPFGDKRKARITKANIKPSGKRISYNGIVFRDGLHNESHRFYGYYQTNLKLMCNKDRNCKDCKHRLECITEE